MENKRSSFTKFQRTKKIFNSTDYMRKSKTLLSTYKGSDSLITQPSNCPSSSRPEIFFPIPDLFTPLNTEPSTCRPPKSKKLSILTEFGLIPEEKTKIKDVKSPIIAQNSIKLTDFLGKTNKRIIFKSLDLKEENRKVKKKPHLLHKIQIKKPQLDYCKKYADVCRNVGMLNGYQQREKYSEELEKIDQIYKSCDNLLKESRNTTRNLKHFTMDFR